MLVATPLRVWNGWKASVAGELVSPFYPLSLLLTFSYLVIWEAAKQRQGNVGSSDIGWQCYALSWGLHPPTCLLYLVRYFPDHEAAERRGGGGENGGHFAF